MGPNGISEQWPGTVDLLERGYSGMSAGADGVLRLKPSLDPEIRHLDFRTYTTGDGSKCRLRVTTSLSVRTDFPTPDTSGLSRGRIRTLLWGDERVCPRRQVTAIRSPSQAV